MMMIQNPATGTGAGACASSSSSSRSIFINNKKRSLLQPHALPNLKLGSHHPSSSSSSSSSVFLRSTSILGSRNRTRNSSSSSNWNRPLFLQATAKIAGGGGGGISDNDITFDSKPANSTGSVLYLGALFGLWYLFNVYFSIYNKQVLNVYPFPLTISAFHFGIGTLFVLAMWSTNLYKKPNISSSQLMAIVPLAIVHTMGNLFTNMSLGKVAVSFTHTIKAMEPFFTVVLSALFLGEVPTIWVLSSLVPIVGGVALASLTEASFNWAGLWSAMASNLTYQSRNVLSKKIMADKEESLDNITLFSVITIMSFFLSVPVALIVEGINFTPSYIQSAGLSAREIYTRSILAGLCFHVYQQVAYMILARVSPLGHSIGNCVKRVVIIVSSVLFFRTPVSLINALGTGLALAGVFLYSRVKNIKAKAS